MSWKRLAGRTLFGLAALGLLAILAGGAMAAYWLSTTPLPEALIRDERRGMLTIRAADGDVILRSGTTAGERLPVSELPPHLVDAVLAIEDRRFGEHAGIDPRAILRAAGVNLAAGGIREGGSTITQQLARLLFLDNERRFARKAREALLALWLERRLSKDRILSLYLDRVFFGAGARGVDAAARVYFGKSARQLDLAEAAMLAGLIRAPSFYSPSRNLQAARGRAAVVLDAMVEAGWLSPERAAEAKAEPARLDLAESVARADSRYFADWIAGQVGWPVAGDVAVDTTLEPRLQALAERVLRSALAEHGERDGVGQAALVAMRGDGAVVAMVGGRDYRESQFNRAVQARRQPGSLFKLFVYQTALENGFDLDHMIDDHPVSVGDWAPENVGGRYHGPVTLREAFAHSLNSVAVQLAEWVGPERVAATARRMGIASPLEPLPSLALGTEEVTLLEMTAAFAAVGADAPSVRPFGIRSLATGGQHFAPQREERTLRGRLYPQLTELLRAVVAEGTGRGATLAGRTAYGKTGTSQDGRDAWFVGFAGGLMAGVWVGNDDFSPTKGVTGGGLPARIWRDFMREADGVVQVASLPGAMDEETVPAFDSPAAQPLKSLRADRAPTPLVVGPEIRPGPGNVKIVRPPWAQQAESEAEVAAPEPLQGKPRILDTATLSFGDRIIRLLGVAGVGGLHADAMRRYVDGRPVQCEAAGDHYRCTIEGRDLSQVVLFNGGGRATGDAPPYLLMAERTARAAGRGIWGQ